MEKQNKPTARKEGEPRISVRPGNFIVPGERAQGGSVPQGRDEQRQGAEQNASQSAGQGGNRHNRHRNRRRNHANQPKNNAGAENQTAQARQAPAPQQAEQKGNRQPNAPRQPEQKDNRQVGTAAGERKQGRRRDRRDRRGDQAAPAHTETPRVEIAPSLQRELDASFVSTSSRSPLSQVKEAEKRMAESAVDTAEFEVDIATAGYLIEDIPCGFPVPDGKTVEVIGVRFRQSGKIYFFDPGNERFKIGEAAIVDTARGPEFGEVALLNRKMAEKYIIQPLRPVLRRATPEDIAHEAENRKSEAEALKVCAEKIAAHKLDMHLVDAQYAFDNSKLLFYFTSEGRVDFRELVRDLAGVFRTRIELRQIGIRDESRLIGGLGMCGRPFCCSTFLSDFGQVSVKMAKEQGLSINTSKISGCCGRLMCCLRYEHESYAAEIALTPKKDARVMTPDGPGTVVDAAPLTGMVKVRRDDASAEAPTAYHRDTLTALDQKAAKVTASAETAESATETAENT